jgi:hypothetical protein
MKYSVVLAAQPAVVIAPCSWEEIMTDKAFRHVRQFSGTFPSTESARFFEAVTDDCNRVVGLSLVVEPTEDHADAQVFAHGSEKLVLSRRDSNGGTELNINGGFRWEHGSWIVDGFYLVKPGGMFQGISCFGLLAADEAAIRLDSSVRIVPVRI